MPDYKIQGSQPSEPRAYINSLSTELFEMIIHEYSAVSVNLQRNSAMNFLLTCRMWKAVGQSYRHLFRPRLVVSGHNEVQQLLSLYKDDKIPPNMTSLTVNLTPYPNGGLARNEMVDAMKQLYQDLDGLRTMFYMDWDESTNKNIRSDWKTLKLDNVSLHVNLSAIPDPPPYLKGWTWHWVAKLGRQLDEFDWQGKSGLYAGGYYSYWDRCVSKAVPKRKCRLI